MMKTKIQRTTDPLTGFVFTQEYGIPGGYDHWNHPKNPEYEIVYGNDENTIFFIVDPDGQILGGSYETLKDAQNALMIYL